MFLHHSLGEGKRGKRAKMQGKCEDADQKKRGTDLHSIEEGDKIEQEMLQIKKVNEHIRAKCL